LFSKFLGKCGRRVGDKASIFERKERARPDRHHLKKHKKGAPTSNRSELGLKEEVG